MRYRDKRLKVSAICAFHRLLFVIRTNYSFLHFSYLTLLYMRITWLSIKNTWPFCCAIYFTELHIASMIVVWYNDKLTKLKNRTTRKCKYESVKKSYIHQCCHRIDMHCPCYSARHHHLRNLDDQQCQQQSIGNTSFKLLIGEADRNMYQEKEKAHNRR